MVRRRIPALVMAEVRGESTVLVVAARNITLHVLTSGMVFDIR